MDVIRPFSTHICHIYTTIRYRLLVLRITQISGVFVGLLLICNVPLNAQADRRIAKAMRVTTPPRIDGQLTEKEWQQLPLFTNFVQYNSYNGPPGSQRTEAWGGYDDKAIYIGAKCYGDSPGAIRRDVGIRDKHPPGMTADVFGVHISTYNDGLHSWFFDVSAAGVQRDMKITGDLLETTWDAVWESRVRITDFGWVVEIRIPLSALRFSSQPVQHWGFNL